MDTYVLRGAAMTRDGEIVRANFTGNERDSEFGRGEGDARAEFAFRCALRDLTPLELFEWDLV